MANALIPIDKAGRLVLPKEVRDSLSIRPGDLLRISIHGNQVTLSPEKPAAGGFSKKGQALVFSTTPSESLRRQTVEEVLTKGAPSTMRTLKSDHA